MIVVRNQAMELEQVPEAWRLSERQRGIVRRMAASRKTYAYGSPHEFHFELALRELTVQAAEELAGSGASFSVFSLSRCNKEVWTRESNGGFRLKSGIKPADAIQDIYRQGRLYGFECATAIVIVLYRAVLACIGETAFNRYFPALTLYSWETDNDLGLATWRPVDYLPGDIRYFSNPDHERPEWQGENVVAIDDGVYFGHGLGVRPYSGILETLNRLRKPSAKRSAYLLETATRPDYAHLAGLSAESAAPASPVRRKQLGAIGFREIVQSWGCQMIHASIGVREMALIF